MPYLPSTVSIFCRTPTTFPAPPVSLMPHPSPVPPYPVIPHRLAPIYPYPNSPLPSPLLPPATLLPIRPLQSLCPFHTSHLSPRFHVASSFQSMHATLLPSPPAPFSNPPRPPFYAHLFDPYLLSPHAPCPPRAATGCCRALPVLPLPPGAAGAALGCCLRCLWLLSLSVAPW